MTKEKSESEIAIEKADRVEEGPSNPLDIFESNEILSSDDAQDEQQKEDLEEEKMQLLEDAIDFGEFSDAEVVEDEQDTKSKEKKTEKKERSKDKSRLDEDEEDEESEEDEDEEQEGEEDEEEPEEETELVKILRSQVDSQNVALQALQSQIAELSKTSAEQKPKEKEEDTPVFNIGVPDEFIQGIASGEPAEIKKTLTLFANGVAEITRKHILEEGRQMLEDRFQQERENLTKVGKLQEESQRITTDFYDTYPGYNRKEIHKLVGACAKHYFDSVPGATWNSVARDSIAAAVKEIVNFDGKADPAKASRKRGRKTSNNDNSDEIKKEKDPKKSAGSRPPRQVKAGTRVAEAVIKRKDRQTDISETFAGFQGR